MTLKAHGDIKKFPRALFQLSTARLTQFHEKSSSREHFWLEFALYLYSLYHKRVIVCCVNFFLFLKTILLFSKNHITNKYAGISSQEKKEGTACCLKQTLWLFWIKHVWFYIPGSMIGLHNMSKGKKKSFKYM